MIYPDNTSPSLKDIKKINLSNDTNDNHLLSNNEDNLNLTDEKRREKLIEETLQNSR